MSICTLAAPMHLVFGHSCVLCCMPRSLVQPGGVSILLVLQDWHGFLEIRVPAITTVARGDQAFCGRVQDVLPGILPSEQLRCGSAVFAKLSLQPSLPNFDYRLWQCQSL